MKDIPPLFSYLLGHDMPRMIKEAIKLHGISEKSGNDNEPTIMQWAKELGGEIALQYQADAIPWCGLFVALVAKRAGKQLPVSDNDKHTPLLSSVWLKFGKRVTEPMLGDVLYFRRTGGGHVGIYVAEDSDYYYLIGGNQNDKVCIAKRKKTTLVAAMRPNYTNKPQSVTKYFVEQSIVADNVVMQKHTES